MPCIQVPFSEPCMDPPLCEIHGMSSAEQLLMPCQRGLPYLTHNVFRFFGLDQ